ncbi:MAG: peptide chain release factor N(5)-glutamine methyltransferase [Pantoea sp. Brub]|nr:peptide chain release factor N(5)-glutamine methyltransferase [Pantoea sp. Brub]
MNINNWFNKISKLSYKIDKNLKYDAKILLSYVTGKSFGWLTAFDEFILSDAQLDQLEILLLRLCRGEPISYIIKTCEFWSLVLNTSKDTMIPRVDTEILVEQALKHLPNMPSKILDLGTGIGNVALAIATERPDCQIIGIDYIETVILKAKENANKLNICNVLFCLSYWFNDLQSNLFDIIVSNPPYIDKDDMHLSMRGIKFEPHSALVASNQGLDDLQIIIKNSPKWLKKNGWLLLEHGWKQGKAVRKIFLKFGYQQIDTIKDYGGNPRVTFGKWSK